MVVRHGHLVYEKYFGRANRLANPNMYSIGKMFTSVSCGIMLAEHANRFPDGLEQKVFTQSFLPQAFPLDYPQMGDIRLGHLLTMTSGLQNSHPPTPGAPSAGHLTGIVHGENVEIPWWTSPTPVTDQDGSTLHGKMWTAPGEGYCYGMDPHIASIVLRGVVGMELQEYVRVKLAEPMGWGSWGWAIHHAGSTLPPHSRSRCDRPPLYGCVAFWISAAEQRQVEGPAVDPGDLRGTAKQTLAV